MSTPNQHEEVLFQAALNLPPKDRDAYLDGAYGEDAQLRGRIVERLFQVDRATCDTADESPTSPSTTMGAIPFVQETPGEKPGDTIGRYKLIEKIGEGGFGVVYVAEQKEPLRRRVAVKVIKLGMDTKQVIARFEAERQALALMDHPNIAKVLDAGATESGRPFFVMELVKGVRITDYCDKNNLSTTERLGLFIQVCHAIQHAHQKGIIHRDIKPSNILVTLHDGVPVPKVIDFGIAKATTGQRLTDKTLYTAIDQFIGTPAYMSPEQAELSGLDIDTRSDIYALGVLLYELLTGKTPFDAKRLVEAGLNEIRRIISEEEPPRPSTRLSILTAEEQTTTARRRQTDPPRLLGLVRGDLDWIVMKTLEKDRTRRYETANGLASDIERHLSNEPIMARPPAVAYRLRKLVQRNRMVFVAAAVVVSTLVIMVALAVGLYAWYNAKLTEQDYLQNLGAPYRPSSFMVYEDSITVTNLIVGQDFTNVLATIRANLKVRRPDRIRLSGRIQIERWVLPFEARCNGTTLILVLPTSNQKYVYQIERSLTETLTKSAGSEKAIGLLQAVFKVYWLLLSPDPKRSIQDLPAPKKLGPLEWWLGERMRRVTWSERLSLVDANRTAGLREFNREANVTFQLLVGERDGLFRHIEADLTELCRPIADDQLRNLDSQKPLKLLLQIFLPDLIDGFREFASGANKSRIIMTASHEGINLHPAVDQEMFKPDEFRDVPQVRKLDVVNIIKGLFLTNTNVSPAGSRPSGQ